MDIVGGATLECPSAKLDHEIFEDGPTVKIGSLEFSSRTVFMKLLLSFFALGSPILG